MLWNKKKNRKLHKDRTLVIDFCNAHNNIYFYGAGNVAKKLIRYFNDEDIPVAGLIVSNGCKKYENIEGIPIYELKDVSFCNGCGVVLAVSEKKQDEIRLELFNLGIKENDVFSQKIFGCGDSTSESDAYYGTKQKGLYFQDNLELDNLGLKYGTDKASDRHDYLRGYELFLERYKNEKITVMELGVEKGQSLKMWTEYFPNAHLLGVDINPECSIFSDERTDIIIADLSDLSELDKLAQFRAKIIIDDASHLWSHQIKALSVLFPSMPRGGIYICEDLGTSFYRYKNSHEADATIRGYDFCSAITKAMNGGKEELVGIESDFEEEIMEIAQNLDMISFIYGSCIMIKN